MDAHSYGYASFEMIFRAALKSRIELLSSCVRSPSRPFILAIPRCIRMRAHCLGTTSCIANVSVVKEIALELICARSPFRCKVYAEASKSRSSMLPDRKLTAVSSSGTASPNLPVKKLPVPSQKNTGRHASFRNDRQGCSVNVWPLVHLVQMQPAMARSSVLTDCLSLARIKISSSLSLGATCSMN